jgi:hypothetical protein
MKNQVYYLLGAGLDRVHDYDSNTTPASSTADKCRDLYILPGGTRSVRVAYRQCKCVGEYCSIHVSGRFLGLLPTYADTLVPRAALEAMRRPRSASSTCTLCSK